MRRETLKPTILKRQSIYSHERRDPRTVRDKDYQNSCLDKLCTFLNDMQYDGNISNINPPSVRDFQSMFKFIVSFLLPQYEYLRFEEDVLSILRILKYPYASEINRSQLITITPHVWPVVLSMMVWLVDLYEKVQSVCYENENLDEIFYEYLCEGYMRFMEGKEEDTDGFEDKIKKFYQGENKRMDEMKLHLDRVNQRVQELENMDFPDNKQRLADMIEDKKSLLLAGNGLDENITKLKDTVSKLTDELEKAEAASKQLKHEQDDLINKIQEQPINPNEVKEMNSEKVELLKEIEAIKPKKDQKFQLCKGVEQEYARIQEELDNLQYDLKNLYPIDEDCPKKIIEILEDVLVNKRIELDRLTDYKTELEEKRVETNDIQKDLEQQLKQLRDKLFRVGKIYFDKKETSEIEQRRCKKEMETLENDLAKLNLESENSLLISEQSLQRAKINLDRLNNRIEVERERINTEVYKFYMNASAMIEKLEELNATLVNLTNEK